MKGAAKTMIQKSGINPARSTRMAEYQARERGVPFDFQHDISFLMAHVRHINRRHRIIHEDFDRRSAPGP